MQKGFSLVELSIVLVILGLLTGGILAGQNLIRAAELRAITNEYQQIRTAYFTFRDKYFALPGDMRNAYDFWGVAAGCTDVVVTSNVNGCNGNGNGTIGDSSEVAERFRFWQHMANAGLIEGSYTGLAGSGGASHHVRGENAKSSRVSNAAYAVITQPIDGYGNSPNFYTGQGADIPFRHLVLGVQTTNGMPHNTFLKPEEAWNIDTKMDDGKPAQGNVRAMANGLFCADDYDVQAAEYDLLITTNSCNLLLSLER